MMLQIYTLIKPADSAATTLMAHWRISSVFHFECPYYHPLRTSLSENMKSLLMFHEYGLIMSSNHMEGFVLTDTY